jgi:hypothetical protein
LGHEGYHRYVVEFRVVQTVEQVNGARTGRRRAHVDPPGELGVADCFEGGHLLVPGLDELRCVVGPAPGREQAVDAVARAGEDTLDNAP